MKSNILCALPAVFAAFSLTACDNAFSEKAKTAQAADSTIKTAAKDTLQAPLSNEPAAIVVDSASFFEKSKYVANGDSSGRWPVASTLPVAGAILPYKRVIAYYGNLYSTRMGILGELPPPQMRAKLQEEVKKWEAADPNTPVQPALHYIAVTAQGSPGKGGKYRLRMPFSQIDSVLNMAKPINAIVFLDIQVGLSNLQEEIPLLEKYLAMPNVHLGIDPEFSMKTGAKPGSRIGTFDAADVNYAADYLANLVKKNNLPAKMLILHRFTRAMLTNIDAIKLRPEVQMVVHMDGWGAPARKINTYRQFVAKEPVEFTGFKLFYKNDLKETPGRMMTPEELMKLKPMPMYIQYQ
ncbi:MAG TPA: hypothetical protein PLQ32_08595 [Flavihumibacter sp.]|nr:hypothetical protein [Flavihumibacter sp.]